MNHSITLDQNKFNDTDGLLLAKHDPNYAVNDTITFTLKGFREQKVRYIKKIHTEKITQHYCMLELSETRGVDDVPASVGDSPTLNELKEQL